MKKYIFHILRRIVGYLFLIVGVLSGFLPILQGWIFIALGLILLKNEPWVRKIILWLYKRYPDKRHHFKNIHKKLDEWFGKWWRH